MPRAKARTTYHHGDLRAALLRAGIELVSRHGDPRLHDVAGREGPRPSRSRRHTVTTRIATRCSRRSRSEGFHQLATRFEAVGPGKDRSARLAAAYVGFAVEHPAQFRVMFEGQLDKARYPDLKAAGDRAFGVLISEAAALAGPKASAAKRATATAALWSVVHGFATIAIEDGFSQLQGGLSSEELLRGAIKHVVDSM